MRTRNQYTPAEKEGFDLKTIKTGLIGYGLSGQIFHEPFINCLNGFELHKIFDHNAEHSAVLRNTHKAAQVADCIEDVLEDPEIELVVLSVQNTMHFEYARQALENGKHVLVEKPFTVTSGEADRLIEIAKQAGKILTVYQNRRFDSDFRTLQKVIDSELLGDIAEYEAHYDRFCSEVKANAWRESGGPGTGCLYDLGSHLIDQALVLFGQPKEVLADLGVERENGKATDYFTLLLRYERLRVTLKAGTLVRELGPRYIVNGTKGSFVKYGLDVQEEQLKKGADPLTTEFWGREPEAIWGTLHTDGNGAQIKIKVASEPGDYRLFYQNLYDALCGNASLAVTPEQARNTICVIELAMKSSESKQWVPV